MQVLIENSHAFLTYPINYFSLTVIEHHDQKHIKQVFFSYGSRGIESIMMEKSMATVIENMEPGAGRWMITILSIH